MVHHTILVSAEIVIPDTYILLHRQWIVSMACRFAGILSISSYLLSLYTLTLITLQRFIGIVLVFQVKELGVHSVTNGLSVGDLFVLMITIQYVLLNQRDDIMATISDLTVCFSLYL